MHRGYDKGGLISFFVMYHSFVPSKDCFFVCESICCSLPLQPEVPSASKRCSTSSIFIVGKSFFAAFFRDHYQINRFIYRVSQKKRNTFEMVAKLSIYNFMKKCRYVWKAKGPTFYMI